MCLNYKNAIINSETRACKCLYKEFGANRVTLSVKFSSFLPDHEHFKNQALKLIEIVMQVRRSQTVLSLKCLPMFLCTLMVVVARVTDIFCIAQITCKFIHNTLLVNNDNDDMRSSKRHVTFSFKILRINNYLL